MIRAIRIVAPHALWLMLLTGSVVPSVAQQPAPPARTTYDDMRMFSQVLNQIRVNHADSVTPNALMLAAVEGMIRATDPHSYLLPASRTAASNELALVQGKVVSVPLVFDYVGNTPFLVSVAPGSAAARVDLLPGDELLAASGQPIAARSSAELELVLAGPPGSEIDLSFDRLSGDGTHVRIERRVKRERAAELQTVQVATMLQGHTAYLRLASFLSAHTADDVGAALKRLSGQGMDRLVLDLRDNGGGLVKQAATIAGMMLPPGSVIAIDEFRRRAPDTLRADTNATKTTYRQPLVVLVNAGTASAAELLTGALQDHDRAIVVGRPTFGKALILQPFPLTDGSVMWLTVGKTRTPCGRIIQREYRNRTAREYFRGAEAPRDTTGREHCTTDAGRTLLGGGGIVPDVAIARGEARAAWITSLADESLLQWLGQFLQQHGATFARPDDLLDAARLDVAVADLRAFADRRHITLPTDDTTTSELRELARNAIAWTRFGPGERYRIGASTDPDVAAGVAALDRAAALPAAR